MSPIELRVHFMIIRQALAYSRDAFKWLYVFNAVVPKAEAKEFIKDMDILTDADIEEIDDYYTNIRSGSSR